MELCVEKGYPASVAKACISPFLGNTIAAMKQEVVHHSHRKAAVQALKAFLDDPILASAAAAKKGDACKLTVRILLWTIRQKWYTVCYWLLKMKL